MLNSSELLNNMLGTWSDNQYTQLPCKVEAVNGNFVDVLMIINDEEPDFVIYNVPIKREETKKAYIFLGIKAGDYGTLRFYDRSINGFMNGNLEYDGDPRIHDINDRCFELGFIPNPEAFVYPENTDIEIGLKDGSAKINLTDGMVTVTGVTLDINAESVNVNATTVNLGENTTIDGKIFLDHTHTSGAQGSPTSGVL